MATAGNSTHKFDYVAGIVVAFSTGGELDPADWDATIECLRTSEPLLGYLGASLGTVEVSGAQRRAGADIMKQRGLPTAIVTENRVVMGIATAAGWLGANIKAFNWEQLEAAIEYLGASGPAVSQVVDRLHYLKAQALAEVEVDRQRRSARLS